MSKLVRCVTTLFLLTIALFANGQFLFGDHCTVTPNGLPDIGGDVTVPSDCLRGSLWWNYPRGTLRVTWRQPRPFVVCLTPTLGPHLSNVSQLLDSGVVTVPAPADDVETICLPQSDTKVEALLEQPPYLTYMTLYNYTLHFQP